MTNESYNHLLHRFVLRFSDIGKSKNYWKCTTHTPENRGGWTLFHPPPNEEKLTIRLKEKAKLIRCTNWLVSKNYCSFWRNGPPVKNDLNTQQKLTYSKSGQTFRKNHAWPNMGYNERTFST